METIGDNSANKQVYGEVPLLVQLQKAMENLDAFMNENPDLEDVAVTRKHSCILKEHVEPRPDFANVKFSLKNRFSHLVSYRKKKIIENIEDVKEKCVAIIGLSGIGGLVAEMLTRSGIGKLTLIDNGVVKMASMGRMFFLPEHAGMSKVQAARLSLRQLNPHVEIETFHCNINDELDADILMDVLQDCKLEQPTPAIDPTKAASSTNQPVFRLPMDAIICCVDNSHARNRVNQIALQLSIPLIDVRVSPCSSHITIQTIFPGFSACMQCHWNERYEAEAATSDSVSRQCPAALPQCELLAAGLVSQSAIKLLLEFGQQIPFYRVDCLEMDISSYWFRPNPQCTEPMCKLKQDEYNADIAKQSDGIHERVVAPKAARREDDDDSDAGI